MCCTPIVNKKLITKSIIVIKMHLVKFVCSSSQHVTKRFCLPPYPKSVCPSVGPQLFLFMSHALFLFSLNRSISSPFRRVLSLLAFGNTISRAHIYMLTLFTIYSFAVFQIDLLYALRYNSLQRHFNNNNQVLNRFDG